MEKYKIEKSYCITELHFLSKKEVCIALSISLPTLNRRLADNTIPSVHMGARVLIPAAFIHELVERSMNSVKKAVVIKEGGNNHAGTRYV